MLRPAWLPTSSVGVGGGHSIRPPSPESSIPHLRSKASRGGGPIGIGFSVNEPPISATADPQRIDGISPRTHTGWGGRVERVGSLFDGRRQARLSHRQYLQYVFILLQEARGRCSKRGVRSGVR